MGVSPDAWESVDNGPETGRILGEQMSSTIEVPRPDVERDDELARYAVLVDPPGNDLQALVDLVAQVCGVPTAAINILSSQHQHQVATIGFDASVCSREDSMCALVLDEPRAVVVSDASLDHRFATNDFVTGVLAAVRFYASAPLVTPDGLVLGRLCVFDDVPRTLTTDQERALETLSNQVMDILELRLRSRALENSLRELTAVRDELRRSNEHLAHFAGQISHDLRSPLTAILANAEMLAEEPAVEVDAELHSMVEAVSSAGHRMNRMIEEMLGLAVEGGQLDLAPTSLPDVVDHVLTDLRPAVTQSGARITIEELPTVHSDPDMLYSIVLNVMTNALKFTRPGITPEVHVHATDLGDRWRVRVDDNGPGIPAPRRESVFEAFERGGSSAPGHGIGLATTRRLVDAHGGRCGVDASPAGGASVWFDLPR